jgi:hypothetical protein
MANALKLLSPIPSLKQNAPLFSLSTYLGSVQTHPNGKISLDMRFVSSSSKKLNKNLCTFSGDFCQASSLFVNQSRVHTKMHSTIIPEMGSKFEQTSLKVKSPSCLLTASQFADSFSLYC